MAGLVLLLLLCNAISIAAQTCLKLGTTRAGKALHDPAQLWRAMLEPLIWVGGFLYAGGTVLWVRVLTTTDLSFAYPFAAVGYAGGVLLSQVMLREHVPPSRWFGLALIAVGIVLVALSART